MFALNLIALASEVDGLYPSTVGWMVIAIAWSTIGAFWMAGSFLTQRASQSTGLASTPWRHLVTLVLNQNDLEVVTVANPEEAIQLAQSERFSLYILDNWMEGMSGIELCTRLREFDSATPILFFSGAGFERDKQNAFDCGAQGYLVKPASPDDLIAEARRLLSASGQGV